MKIIYKGVTYRTENLTKSDKVKMSKEIELAEGKAKKRVKPEPQKHVDRLKQVK